MGNGFSKLGNIIALRRKPQAHVSFAPIRQAEAYWTSLRDGGDIPMRTRIDPRGIANILPHAFMVERLSPSVASIRLAGQHLRDAMGTEPRGLPFGLLFHPDSRASVATALGAVLDTPSIGRIEVSNGNAAQDDRVLARLSLLPLRSPNGMIDRALGVFVPAEQMPTRMMQFHLQDLDLRPVYGPARKDLPEPVEIEAARSHLGQIPYLRLVKS